VDDLLRGAVQPEADLMASQPTTLTSADVRRFERDGYLVVRQAFSRDDGLAMERQWWRELEDAHGIRRDDRSSWRRLRGDLKAAKRDPGQAKILTGRVRGVLDDLLGEGAWLPPRDWGRPHSAAPNRGARPRFMRIRTQVLTHEGRELRDRLEGPPA
jgi:hypothetical protein